MSDAEETEFFEEAPVARMLPGPSPHVLEEMRRIARLRFEQQKTQDDVSPSIVLGEEASYVETTRTDKTIEQYEKRGRQIFHRFLREKGYPHETPMGDIDARVFVSWFISMKPTLKSSTWRFYRQSVFHILAENFDEWVNADFAQSILMRDAESMSRDAVSGSTRSRGTLSGKIKRSSSSLKMKKISPEDFQKIMTWLRYKSRSRSATILATWLKASLLCGLRPSEWQMTELKIVEDPRAIHKRRAWLYVICAKATNNRGFGTSRTLDLSSFTDDEIKIVQSMCQYGRKWLENNTFKENQSTCSHLLNRCVKSLWPRRKMSISLYSTRHQAISNWKSSGKSRAEIAVLAGHASIMTAAEKYGRRTSGWKQIPAMPSAVKEELIVALQREEEFVTRQEEMKRIKTRNPTVSMDR